jgi:hypothetical protein
VRLRRNGPGGTLPGSPFQLLVTAGEASPLGTRIPTAALPLQGAFVSGSSDVRCVCTLKLQARDRMGNPCDSGGADVTCGSASSDEIQSEVRDNSDGTYTLEWWSSSGVLGTYEAFVKINGMHIIGSPAVMHLRQGGDTLGKAIRLAQNAFKLRWLREGIRAWTSFCRRRKVSLERSAKADSYWVKRALAGALNSINEYCTRAAYKAAEAVTRERRKSITVVPNKGRRK